MGYLTRRTLLKIGLGLLLIVVMAWGALRLFFHLNEIPIYDARLIYNFILHSDRPLKQYENLAQQLGYTSSDKLLIIHADDLGLARSVNKASFEALSKEFVNSASVMMPSPFAEEVAAYYLEHPQIDLGLHLTFTAEWTDYKWPGVAPANKIETLLDDEGFLHQKKVTVIKEGINAEIKTELQAQIDYARALGISPTHMDSHEGTLFFDPAFFRTYIEVGHQNQIPVFVPKLLAPHFDEHFPLPPQVVLVDQMFMALKGTELDAMESYYAEVLSSIKPGLNQLLVHLAFDEEEMKAITKDREAYGTKWRAKDYQVVSSKKFQDLLKQNEIKLIQWRDIQAILYPEANASNRL
ncbi:MAG: polysaccharide deacetylase family protein [Cytophagales bacterium]|jgi:predicted glycoside hydrolase/deacetylase ChbG (UPF0249 family)|nr:polysaccharide deacetylase family protein [Cyclobacteriaceae bacterium]|tara:strand:+ start:1712 stop:2767 length:1056 start_codon:yes stop_codon:yes gene_type:complete